MQSFNIKKSIKFNKPKSKISLSLENLLNDNMISSFNNNYNSFSSVKITLSRELNSFKNSSRNDISFCSSSSSKENKNNKITVKYEFTNLKKQFYDEPDSSFYNEFYN